MRYIRIISHCSTSFWGGFFGSLRSPKNHTGGVYYQYVFFPHLWYKDKEDFLSSKISHRSTSFWGEIFGVKIELLNQTGSSENFLEVHQSLNSNSIGELLSPKLRNMAKPAIDVALNNSSIEELISPKTSNLTQSEVDLPPLTSFVFAHKVTKTPTYTSSRYGHHTPFCRARSQCSCSSFYSQPLLHCASVLIYLHQF